MEHLRQFEYDLSPVALLILATYHLHLYQETHNNPISTYQGLSRRTRAFWVASKMKNGKNILAVQTLSNSSMAATFGFSQPVCKMPSAEYIYQRYQYRK